MVCTQRCAQVLLTLDNLANRGQYINARNTFIELLAYGAVPVVNENVRQGAALMHLQSTYPIRVGVVGKETVK